MANNEDPDEMPQNVSFQQDLHCLLHKNIFKGLNTILV